MKFRLLSIFLILLFILFAIAIIDLTIGSIQIPFWDILNTLVSKENTEWGDVIWKIRLPRIITAFLAGAALSVSGLQMQTIFRNPLAGPYVLGISAGASLGVALTIMGFSGFISYSLITGLNNWVIITAAFIGSLAVLFIILLVSIRIKDIMTLLIIGILFGSATSAIVSIMQYFSSENLLKSFVIWTLGSLSGVSNQQLYILIPIVLIGLILSLFSVKILNISLMGENYAKTVGLKVNYSRLMVFTSTSLLTGTITAFCGPIGFIGIAIPHIVRLLLKTTEHLYLIPATILTGAIIMILSDLVSHLPGAGKILPINSVTAIIGIPIIIWVIVKNKKMISV